MNINQEKKVVFQRRKSIKLSGAEEFEAFSIMKQEENDKKKWMINICV